MRKKSLSERLLDESRPEVLLGAAILSIALCGAAGYLYVVKPALLEYQRLADARAAQTLQMDLEPPGPEGVAVASLEARVKSLRDELYGGSSRVSLREMESFVLGALDRISDLHQTELGRVTPGKVDRVLMFDELPYDVEVTGSYDQLFGWLWDAEAELRPMVVKRFSLRSEPNSEQVHMELRLVAYRAEEPSR